MRIIAGAMAIIWIVCGILDGLVWLVTRQVIPNSITHQLISDWNWVAILGATAGWWTIGGDKEK